METTGISLLTISGELV